MTPEILLSLKIYALAIALSMAVALLIRIVVTVVSVTGQKTPQLKPQRTQATGPQETEGHIAVISAAIYAMVGSHRIVHISAQGRGGTWTGEGRYAHHTSHSVPHKPSKR